MREVISVRYVDRFERRSGQFLIAKRVCIYDWSYEFTVQDPERESRRMPYPQGFNVGTPAADDPSYALYREAKDIAASLAQKV